MWCFRGLKGRIYILPNCKKSFGKLQCDVQLEDDATVSRFHAIVSVESSTETETQYECIISDLSKYGTYILRDGEKRKLSVNEKFVLKTGDKVQFGMKDSIFTVTYHSFVIARSNLSEDEVEKLRNITKDLGNVLSENWHSSCTHLTVSKRILFTMKLACALASAKPIVTIMYWEAIKKAIEESTELPEINDFLPIVSEAWLHAHSESFLPKEERKTLFRGLSFVHFCAKQYYAYAPLIIAAGGKSCIYPTRKPLTPRDLTAKNAIVIQQPANDSSQFTQVIAADYPIIYRKLNALKRRMVSDTEIPLAILHCSTEKYCNPKFNFGMLLKSTIQTASPLDIVVVEDTQSIPSTSKRKIGNKEQQRIIPETCDLQDDDVSKKIHLSKEYQKKNISEIKEIIIINNDFSCKSKKQPQIIPETYDISEKDFASDSFSRKSNEKQINSKSYEKNVVLSIDAEKKQQEQNLLQENIEFQQQEEIIIKEKAIPEKDNLIFKKNNVTLKKCNLFSEENKLISTKNNPILEKDLMNKKTDLEKNKSTFEKHNLIMQNDEDGSWKKRPRIVSIKKIDNSNNEIHVKQIKEKTLENDCFINRKPQNSNLEKQNKKSNLIYNLEENQRKDKRVEEKNKKEKGKPRRMATDWYEKYLDHEFTDKILRKDAPCGKKFTKTLVSIPIRKLKADDFAL